jgi:hypothetical protein
MKKIILSCLIFLPLLVSAQEHQVGVRIGEPFSLSYKTFIQEKISVEGLVGRASPNSSQYYRRAFDNSPPVSSAIYTSHTTGDALSLNLRLAYHEDISGEFNITEGALFAFAGGGGQFRTLRANYIWTTPSPSGPNVFRNERRRNVDFGVEGFIGSEYYLEDLPISIFAEVGLFMEIVDRPGHLKLQGGIGARYMF